MCFTVPSLWRAQQELDVVIRRHYNTAVLSFSCSSSLTFYLWQSEISELLKIRSSPLVKVLISFKIGLHSMSMLDIHVYPSYTRIKYLLLNYTCNSFIKKENLQFLAFLKNYDFHKVWDALYVQSWVELFARYVNNLHISCVRKYGFYYSYKQN